MNITLITSVCYIRNIPLVYSRVRSVFTPQQRFEQLKQTIESSRKHLPNNKIVLVEYSKFTDEEIKYLHSHCDYIVNLIDQDLDSEIFSVYKIGERIMTIKALEYIREHISDVGNIFKISGRYYFTDNFKFEDFDNDSFNFYKIQGNINNINTCMYKIPMKFMSDYVNYLIQNKDKHISVYNGSFEKYVAEFVVNNKDNIIFVNNMGVGGLVSVCGSKFLK